MPSAAGGVADHSARGPQCPWHIPTNPTGQGQTRQCSQSLRTKHVDAKHTWQVPERMLTHSSASGCMQRMTFCLWPDTGTQQGLAAFLACRYCLLARKSWVTCDFCIGSLIPSAFYVAFVLSLCFRTQALGKERSLGVRVRGCTSSVSILGCSFFSSTAAILSQ